MRAGLFLLPGAEFLAMILIVVYVGAVAVLFLFVVMMLDVDFAELRQGFTASICRSARCRRGRARSSSASSSAAGRARPARRTPPLRRSSPGVSNTPALGQVLYTKYFFFFQASA